MSVVLLLLIMSVVLSVEPGLFHILFIHSFIQQIDGIVNKFTQTLVCYDYASYNVSNSYVEILWGI